MGSVECASAATSELAAGLNRLRRAVGLGRGDTVRCSLARAGALDDAEENVASSTSSNSLHAH